MWGASKVMLLSVFLHLVVVGQMLMLSLQQTHGAAVLGPSLGSYVFSLNVAPTLSHPRRCAQFSGFDMIT